MSHVLSFFLVSLSAVFFVIDPIGLVPIFLAITANDSPQKARQMAFRACLVASGLLIFFALFGALLFKTLGVSLGAFKVAGGILLLITSLDMLRARTSPTKTSPEETEEGTSKEDVAVVPLAIPLLAGPGAIATVMVLMSQAKRPLWAVLVLVSIALTLLATYFILRGASLIQRVLKRSGLAIVHRVIGLVLAAIAVQFMADGAKDLFGR